MRFAVLGAGAIGAYVGRGARPRRQRRDADRPRPAPARDAGATACGCCSPRGDFAAHPEATDDFAAVSDADVVFVALKAYSLPEIAPRARRACSAGRGGDRGAERHPVVVLPVARRAARRHGARERRPGRRDQRARSGPSAVIGCVVYCSTEIVEPGVIRHIEGTRFAIGEPDGRASERCRRSPTRSWPAGCKCPVETQLRDQIWLKLIGNVAFNPVTALTGATLGELGTVPEIGRAAAGDPRRSAPRSPTRLGIELPVSLDRRLEAGLAVGDHKTSMLQDLEAGKPLELDCLTGAVIELAGRLGARGAAHGGRCTPARSCLRAAPRGRVTPAGATRANSELPGCGSAPPTRGATPSPRSSRPTVGAGNAPRV